MSVEKLHSKDQPLQKDQVYNWYDRYKPKEQAKVHLLSNSARRKPVSLIKRFIEK